MSSHPSICCWRFSSSACCSCIFFLTCLLSCPCLRLLLAHDAIRGVDMFSDDLHQSCPLIFDGNFLPSWCFSGTCTPHLASTTAHGNLFCDCTCATLSFIEGILQASHININAFMLSLLMDCLMPSIISCVATALRLIVLLQFEGCYRRYSLRAAWCCRKVQLSLADSVFPRSGTGQALHNATLFGSQPCLCERIRLCCLQL